MTVGGIGHTDVSQQYVQYNIGYQLRLRALSCIQCNLLSTLTHVSSPVCTWCKADFPPQQTRATTLAPGEACRRKAEACSGTNDTWCYLSDPKRNCAIDRQIPGLNVLADSAVGVAILTWHGRSELQHKLTHVGYTPHKHEND